MTAARRQRASRPDQPQRHSVTAPLAGISAGLCHKATGVGHAGPDTVRDNSLHTESKPCHVPVPLDRRPLAECRIRLGRSPTSLDARSSATRPDWSGNTCPAAPGHTLYALSQEHRLGFRSGVGTGVPWQQRLFSADLTDRLPLREFQLGRAKFVDDLLCGITFSSH